MIAFIAINCILGGFVKSAISESTSSSLTSIDMVTVAETSRDELQIVYAKPVIYEETNIPSVVDVVSEDFSEPVSETDDVYRLELAEEEKIEITLSSITSSSGTAERIYAMFNFLISEGFTP